MMRLLLHVVIVMLVLMTCDANRLKKLEDQMKFIKAFQSYANTRLDTLKADVGSITSRVAKLEALFNESDVGDIDSKRSRTQYNLSKSDVKPELKDIQNTLTMYKHTFAKQKKELIDGNSVIKDTLSVFKKNSSSVINSLVDIVNDHVKKSADNISATLEQINNASVESGSLLRSEILTRLEVISSEVKTDIEMQFEGITQYNNKTLYALKYQVHDQLANETERLEQFKTNILQDVYSIRSDVQNERNEKEKKVEELIGRANKVVGIIADKRSTIEEDIMVTIRALHSSWTDWSAWSDCSQTCDKGLKSRHRTCSVPPALIGAICNGNDTETEECFIHEFCPHWSDWTTWSQCSQTCGNGTITRDRTCQAPASLDSTYQGNMTESQMCVTSVKCQRVASCDDLLSETGSQKSGVYNITTWKSNTTISVYCDMVTEGGGWTVFQRRLDGSVDFYRNFSEYENGFGSASGEYWLGLQTIQEMLGNTNHELRIDVQAFDGASGYDVYSNLSLHGAGYTFYVDHRTRSLNMSNTKQLSAGYPQTPYGQEFTTFDHDQDQHSSVNCAQYYHGAWWYNDCGGANLNADWLGTGRKIEYYPFGVNTYLRSTKMMFRHIGGH